jgi:hypothetical protein
MDNKYQQAKDIALLLSDRDDTEVDETDIESWAEWDLYGWLEAWGHIWAEQEAAWKYCDEQNT